MSSSPPKIVGPDPEAFTGEVTNTDIPPEPGLTIPVTRTDIRYDRDYANSTGWLKIVPDGAATKPDGSATDPLGDTVLHLLSYLIYTREGHDLLMDNPYDRDVTQGLEPESTRKRLLEALMRRFPTLAPRVIVLTIEAHFAAGQYVSDQVNAAQAQDIYKQRLVAILGALHDDLMSCDFSKAW
jgi:hypothetical protein